MLVRLYQFVGIMALSGYAWSSWMGLEFVSPVVVRQAPPINAVIGPTSRGWSGRSSTYHTFGSSGGTRSGWGGFGFGGK